MGLVEDFIARYRKEYDFYDQAARLVAQTLEGSLQAAGIRSMVTSRAKAVGRLEAKVRQRDTSKHYGSVDDIYSDIVDLAGARVALYFPGERAQVDSMIKSLFLLVEQPKEFPGASGPTYAKRFSGYWATHYRVQLREPTLSDAQKRYVEARVEIQVASVLMHAWAEVEHDLVYKPLQGQLSEDEYAILDELNGLVMAGEIALERLQRAGEARVAAGGRAFSNHYDLAAHLLTAAGPVLRGPVADTALGRVDLLFDLLKRLGLATPDLLRPYVTTLHGDTERRPFAEQIIDQLLAEDDARYKVYEEVRASRPAPGDYGPGLREAVEPDLHEAMGFFLAQWIAFERAIRQKTGRRTGEDLSRTVPVFRLLEKSGVLDNDTRREVELIRRIRNNVVHGIEIPDSIALREAAERLQAITERLNEQE
jgi:ppGpp synthetase/RelA/SpoT-type nucleotidyltranferase